MSHGAILSAGFSASCHSSYIFITFSYCRIYLKTSVFLDCSRDFDWEMFLQFPFNFSLKFLILLPLEKCTFVFVQKLSFTYFLQTLKIHSIYFYYINLKGQTCKILWPLPSNKFGWNIVCSSVCGINVYHIEMMYHAQDPGL